jgi:hypothetical protein
MFLISSIRSKNKDVVFAHSRNVRLNMNRWKGFDVADQWKGKQNQS